MAIQPLGTPANGSSIQPLGSSPVAQGGGNIVADIAGGALDFVNNNSLSKAVTSSAAFPLQLAVKGYNAVTGSHVADPFAGGIGTGPGAAHVTSSDQPLSKWAEAELGNALTVGSLFFPVGKAAGLAQTGLKSVLPRAIAGAAGPTARIGVQTALGATQGLAGGMQEGKDIKDLPGSAAVGALLGGLFASAGEIGSAALSRFDKTGADRLTEHVKEGGAAKSLTKVLKETSTKTTDPITTMKQNNLIKDLEVGSGRINIERLTNPTGTGSLDALIQEQKDMGTQAVGQMQGGLPIEKFKESVVNAIKASPALKASGNIGKMVAEVGRRFDDYAESYGEVIPYEDVNRVRVAMNKVWNPETWDAEKMIGNAARDILYSGKGAGTILKSAMDNERELLSAMEFIQKLNATAVKGGRGGKYIADAVGALLGGAAGGVLGSALGPVGAGAGTFAGGTVAAKTTDAFINAVQSNFFKPVLANKAQGLQRFISAPAVQGGRQLLKAGIITGAGK